MGRELRPRNVLFLCTGNSARSILAEALLNHLSEGRFRGYSAGSFPTGRVNPLALELLARRGIPAMGARSKSWDEFAVPGSIEFDCVITVCDRAAAESCPVWPGHPVTAHWGVPDPAAVEGDAAARMRAFEDAGAALEGRIRRLVSLPGDEFEPERLRVRLAEIGRSGPERRSC